MFKNNVGNIDKIVRIILGVVLLGAFFMYPDMPYRWVTLIGIVPLLTAFMGSCPLYSIFGMSTCPMKKS